jgi:excisionase family DNA binding protein
MAGQTLIAMTPEQITALVKGAVREAMAGAAEAPQYLTAAEIAKCFRVSRPTVSKWTAAGCPHIMRGNVLRFELAAVQAWFDGRQPGLRRVK